ncbi:hypothetical protein EO057_13395 [Salmonella enterica subsp. enterica serovar Enteritidis]|uniref:Uncharacterized protein n=1 Tax=Salmonella enteritidis TaxID=149539 RepID=A0A3Y0XY20_SALEN|nr:hypothetical protein [Salmonella enterica subsp. enterica serovar Enteritidis]EAA1943692.1 hypothetical protein [Salmonella enterica subsp. enterica serovar Enteritidis]EAA5504547.1 hypothetical protein [Salmonella enterica subsp. enterica serovar Enteritidis]EAA5532508.1 hypothetical protein [Salmonella enterica subsp. enterica serovar Enteritidis]EAB5977654.1 hypothetical protein [Salmonella enterica subsp. enterica serovar Enteritidis]
MAETKKKQKCNINIAKITEKTVIKLKAAITMKFRCYCFDIGEVGCNNWDVVKVCDVSPHRVGRGSAISRAP